MKQDEAIKILQPIIYLVRLKNGLSFFLDKIFKYIEENPNIDLTSKEIKYIKTIKKYAK